MEVIYTDECLLNRIYDKIDGIKTEKFSVCKPKSEKKNGKTVITNFGAFCESIKRDQNTVKLYVEDELKIDTSITSSEMLLINKCYQQVEIEGILGRYIKTFVMCPEIKCGSGNTDIIRENRIKFLVCNVCHSKKSI